MEHDDVSRVALLLDNPNGDALALRTVSQPGEKLQALALT